MLKRILNILTSSKSSHSPLVIRSPDHGIDNNVLSRNAIKVVAALKSAGYSAYIVGGGVRDSLLESKPKDFDVATNATPEQVRGVFNRATIIGRRFRIVHVRFGREIIEVTTFRAHHEQAKNSRQAEQSDHGLLLRDNVYGDIESDAIRRDFTVNALYYDPTTEELFDFTNGLADLQSRTLKMIGDPAARYREDPVRILRAIRFSAKLGFTLDKATAKPIKELANLLDHIPPARLFEEVLKLMLGGSATATMELLRSYDVLAHLFPGAEKVLQLGDSFDQQLIEQVCVNTDKRIRQSKRVTPAFVYAAFLWLPLRAKIAELKSEKGLNDGDAHQAASQIVISQQLGKTAIPKRFLIPLREIWSLQHRFWKRDKKRVFTLLEHSRFRAAYDFLLLREQAGEDVGDLATWWTKIQDVDDAGKHAMIDELNKSAPRKRNRRPRRRKPSGQGNRGPAPSPPAND